MCHVFNEAHKEKNMCLHDPRLSADPPTWDGKAGTHGPSGVSESLDLVCRGILNSLHMCAETTGVTWIHTGYLYSEQRRVILSVQRNGHRSPTNYSIQCSWVKREYLSQCNWNDGAWVGGRKTPVLKFVASRRCFLRTTEMEKSSLKKKKSNVSYTKFLG